MRRPHQVEPRWVLVAGELHQVSEYAHLSPRQRPPAICPVCERPVLLKLGTQRVHHYAHQPEDICAATQPETALHLNTKFYLYQQLREADALLIEESCSRCHQTQRQWAWLGGWEQVMVERGVGSFRPDISLYLEGRVVGAIEVLVTHRVSDQKADFFREEAIGWLEVPASEALYDGPEAWVPTKPLPYLRRGPTHDRWVCKGCQQQAQIRAREAERTQARLAYEEANYEETIAAKMVDFYFRSGKKYREIYYVVQRVRGGEWVRTWVKTRNHVVLAAINGPLTAESQPVLRDAVRQQMRQKEAQGAIVDEIIPWRRWEPGNKFVARDFDRFPYRYEWNEAARRWERSQGAPLVDPPEW